MVYKGDKPLFFSQCSHSMVFFVVKPEALLLLYYIANSPFLE